MTPSVALRAVVSIYTGMAPAEAQSFTSFVRQNGDGFVRLSAGLATTREDAQDLLSESLATLWRQWSRVSSADNPLAYARRVIVNTNLQTGRKSAFQSRLLSKLKIHAPPDESRRNSHDIDEWDSIAQQLAVLSSKERTAIVLKYLLDMPTDKIAEILSCPAGSVRVYVSRGLAKLSKGLLESESRGK